MSRSRSWIPLGLVLLVLTASAPAEALFGPVRIRVAEPAIGDEVVYTDGEPESSEGSSRASRAFTWAERAQSVDRWGRAREVDVLRQYYPIEPTEGGGPRWYESATAFASGGRAIWTTFRVEHSERVDGTSGGNPLFPSARDGEFGFQYNATHYLDGEVLHIDCFARNPLQGTEIAEGDIVPFERLCPAFARETAGARVTARPAEATTFLDRPALALAYVATAVGGSGEGEFRVVFVDGLPYPGEISTRFRAAAATSTGAAATECAPGALGPVDCENAASKSSTVSAAGHTSRETLTGFRPGSGGALLAIEAPEPDAPLSRPGARFAPLTRAGPEDGASSLPYALGEAVANVDGDVTLARYQAWRAAHAEAVLAYATFEVLEDGAGAAPATRGAVSWTLLFADASGAAYRVRSEKTLAASAAGNPLAPPVKPVRNEDFGEERSETGAPRPGDLPRGLDLASALVAWERHVPASARSVGVNRVTYEIQRVDSSFEYTIAVAHERRERGAEGNRVLSLSLDARSGAARELAESSFSWPGYAFLPFSAAPVERAPSKSTAPFFLTGDAPTTVEFVVGAAGLSALAAILGALAYFKGWFTPLFTRLKRTEVLDNELRRRLYERISTEPGIHLSALAEETRAGNGAIVYHLNTLEREGLVRSVELPGYRRYFVTGSASPRAMRALAELRAGSAQAIYDVVRANPGISPSDVASRIGVSPPAVHKTVERLVEVGLIEKTRNGKVAALTARDPNSVN